MTVPPAMKKDAIDENTDDGLLNNSLPHPSRPVFHFTCSASKPECAKSVNLSKSRKVSSRRTLALLLARAMTPKEEIPRQRRGYLVFCALAERDPAAAERALIALGDNDCWGESVIILSRSFGEGLLARMTKDEARARTAFEAARAQQEKIVQAQPDYGPALCVLGLIDAALGRKDLALDEGHRAIALTPLEKDVVNGSRVLQY